MFHMVGVTPEAPDLVTAFGGRPPARVINIGRAEIAEAFAELSSRVTQPLGSVSVGTPHFSLEEFRRMHELLAGRRIAPSIEFFISTGRDVLAQVDAHGWGDALRASGVRIVTDTCTYLTPILRSRPGAVMTNSAKWAWYAPGNLGYEVIFASLEECVESAVQGEVRRLDRWSSSGSEAVGLADEAAPVSARQGHVDVPSRVLIPGEAVGEVLALTDPLSFWGGVRESDGTIIDVHHPQQGASVRVMPGGRGSSSSSSVLAELIRGEVAPAAIVLREGDPILALGAMVGELLYGRTVPMLQLNGSAYAGAAALVHARVERDGAVTST
jgi:predicted aconitase with swiveling domain